MYGEEFYMEVDNEIIETDDDTKLQDEDESLYPYDPTEEDIDIRENPHTVFELMRKYKQKKLIINPEFQRNLVWTQKQKSRFIESIILNFPLPPWYINENKEGKYIVVDGLQRTTALYEFTNDEFALKGLEALPKLNGKKFSELDNNHDEFHGYQARIEDKKLMLYVLRPSVPLKVIYDIFNRINTGGTQLTRQEVRNCIFIGHATEFLKELSDSEVFRKAIDNGISNKRMKDREAVLRYLSFKINSYKDYKGDMSDFVENTMRKINVMSDNERNDLKMDFMRVMEKTCFFFENKNFRIPTEVTRGKVNIAVLESVGHFFSSKDDDFLKHNRKKIQSNYQSLLQDEVFIDAVKTSTGAKNSVINRFERVHAILGNV